ncbi:glycosyltransferase family 2 protein [Waterburya agarophytonicola K14]|uniref:Glycosyltransferase family 2 protein n=1 Tax=Waterburya agarophytonicola KI4 TaxID=2874699 RepID=A0A964FEZ7_9CYAN|nr:glycosyltransferase family 2 protein [Waterburya agarophytonicola]MCC0176457.1 glycosyltransferase family 2 protein [Waterburya agarophytonicola KI4]
MDKFVSVIIPVLNNIEGLCQTLSALDKQTYPSQLYEVIVVDNGSSQDLKSAIAQFDRARLSYEECPGSYIARNQGISIAKGEILAFTDSDCIPEPDWLANGVKCLSSVDNCGLVAGKINFFYQNPQRPTTVELYDRATFLNQKKYIEQYRYGATANMFTWKKVVEEVGYFNGELKSGGDKEWGQRVSRHGYILLYSSDTCIAHPARSSWQEISQKIARTRMGGYEVDRLSSQSKLLFYGRKLLTIIWRLKPPTKSALEKLKECDRSLTVIQKIKLLGAILAIHYQGAWVEIEMYFKNLKYIF